MASPRRPPGSSSVARASRPVELDRGSRRFTRPAARRAAIRRRRIAAVAALLLAAAGIGWFIKGSAGDSAPRAATPVRSSAAAPGATAIAEKRHGRTFPAPVVAQRLHNNCESAALEVLLATHGTRVNQLRLQAALPRSGPLDPQGTGPDRVWGDPDRGFVGRADGGGTAGGFGVYPGPVAAVAARYEVPLRNLTARAPSRVYRALAQGHAVMVWVGLGAGPYGTWRAPSGRRIRVNFNEHTVVLTGIGKGGVLSVVNVLHGTRERWSRARFELMWRRLGRRALEA